MTVVGTPQHAAVGASLARLDRVSQDAVSMEALSVPDNVRRIRLEHLRMPPNIPAGMNMLRIASIADTLRNGGEVWEPAKVRYEGPDCYSITDGKHRYMGSYVAGKADLLCEVER